MTKITLCYDGSNCIPRVFFKQEQRVPPVIFGRDKSNVDQSNELVNELLVNTQWFVVLFALAQCSDLDVGFHLSLRNKYFIDV